MGPRMSMTERRSQLVDAALCVAAEEGIAAATVRRVAEQAGVALGVVHYCFADKDELLTALAARIVDDVSGAGAAALRLGKAPDLGAALAIAVEGIWADVEQSAGEKLLAYEITALALRSQELRGVAERQCAASQAAAERLLELAAQAAGAAWHRPVSDLAAEVLAFVDGVTLRWLVDRDAAAARERLRSFADYLAGQAAQPRRRATSAARDRQRNRA